MIAGFILSHLGLTLVLLGFIMPRYYDVFVPPRRQHEGMEKTVANLPKMRVTEPAAGEPGVDMGEAGSDSPITPNKSSDDEKKLDG